MNAYITTPIFYVNAQPHLGHAYTTIVADTYARFRKLDGAVSRFQTGTDEHGDKIAEAADRAGISAQEYADRISGEFRELWPQLNIAPDRFIRTTDQDHKQVVAKVLQKIYDQGDIVFSDYTGLYCQGCERFLTEKELEEGLCPDHKKAPQEITEKNYFFKMSRYQEWLIDHIKSNPEFITPERYRNEVLSFLKEPLEDLCISRPTSRLTWGIPLPFDENFVTYVWFDALINYVTGLGYAPDQPAGSDFTEYWPVAEHVIAKDILKPHAIFWPTMLKAMGLEPYKKLHVHGYWNVDDTKMSKSLGNVIRPLELAQEFGVDTMRYFLLREMSFGLDSSFSHQALVGRQNSDLANDLGNLFSRSLAMVKKFCNNRIPEAGPLNEQDEKLKRDSLKMIELFRREMSAFAFNKALQNVWTVVSRANKYIVSNEPWSLAKDPEQQERLNTVLYNLLEALRLIGLPLQAVMPETAAKMYGALGLEQTPDLCNQASWGGFLETGRELGQAAALFPRIDKKSAKGQGAKEAQAKEAKKAKADKGKKQKKPVLKKEESGLVGFDEFQRFEFRVATIVAAEKVKKSDRLLKLTVQAPEERTVVAGIAEHYQPEEVVGRQVIIVANLKPAKIMGIESNGMVMAAKSDGRLVLSAVSQEVEAGSKVS